jgi:2-oxoisovalerate dehydrogenase E1 component alpha subunit
MSNKSGSRLRTPSSPARPGSDPDFRYLEVTAAGTVEKPGVEDPYGKLEFLSEKLVRVLDAEGRAVGPWNPSLDPETLLAALKWMMLTREFDNRMWQAHRQGKISFYMPSLGEEAVSVGQGMALLPDDMCFPSYRNQGLFLYRGTPLRDLMCQCLSNSGDMCKGRQMPVMYHDRKANIFTVSGNLATQYPQAVGWAMAAAIKGDDNIASAWIGEGSTAEGDFHYALTFAAVYQAPVLLNIVNNQWAISTFQTFAGGERRSFAAHGLGFGIPGIRVDGNDLLAVCAVTRWAAERARSGHGPTIIELVTYRGGAHSTSDDPTKYRAKDEWSAFPLGDPVTRLKQHLIPIDQWSEDAHKDLQAQTKIAVQAAWQEAQALGSLEAGLKLDPASMFDDVYEQLPRHLKAQREQYLSLDG